jgi:hypothetical protein
LIESVASGVPRLDYFTSGGTAGCPALLVEPSAANGILDSADTATNWTIGASLSGTYENVIGVSGNNLTVAVSGSNIGVAAGRLTRVNNSVALASGSTYTISFLMRQTGTHTIGGYYAVITGGAAGDLGAGFNVSGSFSSGSIFNTAGTTSRIRRVERFGADVYRCSETFTMTASGTLTNFNLAPISGVTSQFNPAVGLGIAFAAPQIELGAVPTTFIPTTAAAVTRNADVVTLSGAVSGCIGQTEGTIYAEVDVQFNNRNADIIGLDSGSSANGFYLTIRSSSVIELRVRQSSTNALIFQRTGAYPVGINKIAVSYKNGDFAISLNGTTTQVDTSTITMPSVAITRASVVPSVNFTLDQSVRVRSAALYSTRLTDSELAALTQL